MQYPKTPAGVLITIGIVAFLVVIAATSGLLTYILGGVLIAAILYAVYVIGLNLHRWSTTLYDRRRD